MSPFTLAIALLVLLSSPVTAQEMTPRESAPTTATKENLVGCLIKGNIGKNGEHIYHVPGGAYYDRTKIDPAKGEQWFCAEEKAKAAGWRRAKR